MKALWTLAVSLILLAMSSGHGAVGAAKMPAPNTFPRTVRVRLWYLHPPKELRVSAEVGKALLRKCVTCSATPIDKLALRASASSIQFVEANANANEIFLSGNYRLSPEEGSPVPADFPLEIQARDSRLLVTALLPMDEYVAGVLAGETGNFKSDEALKAMSVAVRTYAMHFGSRHGLEGFAFCDTTHCQDLRLGATNARLRKIADSTAGEVLWYDGEPAATYYFANCGGTTEDGRYILGNDEARAPYLTQHSDQYCRRNGGTQWRSDIPKAELQRALAVDGISVPGELRSVSVLQRTASGRVEFLRVAGRSPITVSGLAFRSAVGRHIGWDRLKSSLYDVSEHGDGITFHGRGFGHGVGLCQVGAEVMGEEGRSYRQILNFYYPGTRLGLAAQGFAWQQMSNDDIELLTTRAQRDRALLPLATRYLHAAEESTGLVYQARPKLKVYGTVAEYRDATGEPGWVAASTRGRTIQMQPPEVLREAGVLDSTLRHELLHMLIDSHAAAGTPRWLREGLVLYLSQPGDPPPVQVSTAGNAALEKSLRSPQSEEELREAYAQARSRVAHLVQQRGKETVLEWLQHGGIPPDLLSSSSE
jgi:stage II sporulation protein D